MTKAGRAGSVAKGQSRPDLTIHGQSLESMGSQFASGISFVQGLEAEGVHLVDLPERLNDLVRLRVNTMVRLIEGTDSIDLLGCMRQVDVTNIMASQGESMSTVGQSHAVTEIVCLVLLGLGLPRVSEDDATRAAELVGPLRELSSWIVQAAQMAAVVDGETSSDSMERVALRARSDGIATRNAHYTSIGRRMNRSFLTRPKVAERMKARLGFTMDDVDVVQASLEAIQTSRIHEAFEKFGAVMSLDDPPGGKAMDAIDRLMERPGWMFTVSAIDIAREGGIETPVARAVLDKFSYAANGDDPALLIERFVKGINPLANAGIIGLDDGTYFALSTAMLSEHIRRVLENQFKSTPDWALFDDQRKKWSESRAKALIGALLGGVRPAHEGFNYLVPDEGTDLSVLAAAAPPPATGVHQVEADLLFVVDKVAFCVEVKAGAMNDRARSGDTRAAARALGELIRKADAQAERLRVLILANGGFWTARRTWVPLDVREVHTVIVTLDDLGPVILSMAALMESGLVSSERVPWIVSLHDLEVVRQILDEPAQFLTYLRRRTHSEAARWLDARDELDVLMFFVRGNLYFESDPDINSTTSRARPPTVGARRRYKQQSHVLVGTLTDPLDAWIEPRGEALGPKPVRDEGPLIGRILAWSRVQQVDGWLRVGADLVGLASPPRRNLEDAERRARQAAHSATSASMTIGGDDGSTAWLFVLGGDSPGHRIDVKSYLPLKKYQVGSDRATALILGPDGSPTRYEHIDASWVHDEDLEQRVQIAERAGRLVDLTRTPSSVPPSAKRATKRLRGKRPKRGRRH
jgi:hypothetical protein